MPAIEADAERNAGFGAGCNRIFGVAAGERKRLFDKDMLAGFGRGDDLAVVMRMRCGEDEGVDIRAGERIFLLLKKLKAKLAGKLLVPRRITGDGRVEPDQ